MEESFEHKVIGKLSRFIHVAAKEEIKKVLSDFDSEICAIRPKLMDIKKLSKTLVVLQTLCNVRHIHVL